MTVAWRQDLGSSEATRLLLNIVARVQAIWGASSYRTLGCNPSGPGAPVTFRPRSFSRTSAVNLPQINMFNFRHQMKYFWTQIKSMVLINSLTHLPLKHVLRDYDCEKGGQKKKHTCHVALECWFHPQYNGCKWNLQGGMATATLGTQQCYILALFKTQFAQKWHFKIQSQSDGIVKNCMSIPILLYCISV